MILLIENMLWILMPIIYWNLLIIYVLKLLVILYHILNILIKIVAVYTTDFLLIQLFKEKLLVHEIFIRIQLKLFSQFIHLSLTIYLKVQVVLSIYVLLLRKKWKVALSEWQIVVLNIIQNFSIIVYNRLWILLKLKRNNLLILMLPWYLLTHIKRQIWVRLMLHVILNLVVLYVI